ncbi:hypothetical protein [Gordonia iterans]|nr:hypothetical protein [Gordonia iterans]
MLTSTRRRILAMMAVFALVLSALMIGGPASADGDDSSGPGSSTSASTSEESPADDDPPPGSVSSSVPSSPSSSVPSSSPSSSSPSSEPPTADGFLHMRAIDITTGRELVNVPARVWRPTETSDTTMPSAFALPPGPYRVEVLAVPAGYRLVSSWAFNAIVVSQKESWVTFEFAPVSGQRGRVPIKKIPSGRTQ